MGPLFSAYVLAMLLGIVFIPLFVIALVMLRSASRAFVLASTFTMGAMIGFFLGVLAGSWLLEVHRRTDRLTRAAVHLRRRERGGGRRDRDLAARKTLRQSAVAA